MMMIWLQPLPEGTMTLSFSMFSMHWLIKYATGGGVFVEQQPVADGTLSVCIA